MKFYAIFLSLLVSSLSFGALVPMSVVDGNLIHYSKEEIALIKEDLANINALVFRSKTPSKQPIYLATAGGPGACKSTILETILHEDPTVANMAYIDPDPQSLRLMMNTYLTKGLSFYAIREGGSFPKVQVDAYTYWRAGSNYIAQTLLNRAVAGRFNIAHGTTSTSPVVGKLYEVLKENGYTLHFVLCYAKDETRQKAFEHRMETQANYQATPEDAVQKGRLFPERFPLYFKFGDSLRLYWTCDFSKGSKEVARIEGGVLTVKDKKGYRRFVAHYESARSRSEKDLPSWADLLKLQKITG